MIRDRKRQVLESQYKVAAPWKEGEAGYEQPDVENWFLKVTIPAIVST